MMYPGHLKELADTVVKIADKYKDSPAAELDVSKSYFLGLGDGITHGTLDSQDTCTRCGARTKDTGYVLGYPGMYCQECSKIISASSEGACPYGNEFGRDWDTRAACASCPNRIHDRCGEKAKEMGDRCPNGFNFGKDWNTRASCASCPNCIYRKCEMKAEATESREELPEHKEPAATGHKMHEMHGKLAPKCSICCNEVELTSILTHNGRIFKLCDRCRKALDDPKVQEALHKG